MRPNIAHLPAADRRFKNLMLLNGFNAVSFCKSCHRVLRYAQKLQELYEKLLSEGCYRFYIEGVGGPITWSYLPDMPIY